MLNLAGSIVDQKQQVDPLEAAFKQGQNANADGEILLADVLYVIDNAAQDQRISVLVLDLVDLKRAGISKLQSIGNALNRFKESGKKSSPLATTTSKINISSPVLPTPFTSIPKAVSRLMA